MQANSLLHPHKPMEDDVDACKVLIEPHDAVANCDDDDDEDDEAYNSTDESHVIYVLNMILSGTARLNVLLPTATILAFTIFAPLLTDDGRCDVLNRWLTAAFVGVCAASCVFFAFTDSFRTKSGGRLRYGIATFRGIRTFNGRGKAPPEEAARCCRLRWADLFHAVLSVAAFLTFAGSHHDVVRCYYPAMPRKVTNTVPLVVGFLVSVVFVVFPSRRRGIGYPFLLMHTDHRRASWS